MPLQMQPRSWFAFSVPVALCWLMLSLSSARTPRCPAARCPPGTQILHCALCCPLSQVQHFDSCLFFSSCQPPVPAASEDVTPLWHIFLASQLSALSKLAEGAANYPKAPFCSVWIFNFSFLLDPIYFLTQRFLHRDFASSVHQCKSFH